MKNASTLAEPASQWGPLGTELVALSSALSRCQYQMVIAAAAFAESPEWVLDGSPTPAHWLAAVADVEGSTAREWIRIGKALTVLPVTAEAFAERRLSYSKVRTLTRSATPETEAELVDLVADVAASEVGKVIAGWMNRNLAPEDIAARQRAARSVKWRTDPDGLVTFTVRLQPHIAAMLISLLTVMVMRSKSRREPDGTYPATTAQYADAVEEILAQGAGRVDTEVVFHVRGDGVTTDDGTPICDTVIAALVPDAFIRLLIHDAQGRPINASGRQRHPTARQRRTGRSPVGPVRCAWGIMQGSVDRMNRCRPSFVRTRGMAAEVAVGELEHLLEVGQVGTFRLGKKDHHAGAVALVDDVVDVVGRMGDTRRLLTAWSHPCHLTLDNPT